MNGKIFLTLLSGVGLGAGAVLALQNPAGAQATATSFPGQTCESVGPISSGRSIGRPHCTFKFADGTRCMSIFDPASAPSVAISCVAAPPGPPAPPMPPTGVKTN